MASNEDLFSIASPSDGFMPSKKRPRPVRIDDPPIIVPSTPPKRSIQTKIPLKVEGQLTCRMCGKPLSSIAKVYVHLNVYHSIPLRIFEDDPELVNTVITTKILV